MKNINFLIFLSVLFLFSACSKKNEKAGTDSARIKKFELNDSMSAKIEISNAAIEKVQGKIILNGKVSADENNVMDVFPLVGGHVREIYAILGQYVKKGDVLAVIFSNEIAEYDKEYKSAQQDLVLAEKSLKNAKDMFEARLIAEKELLTFQYEVDKAKLAVRRLEESRKLYGTNDKSEYIVRAPMSGFIIHKNISKDQQLRSDNGQSMYTIAEINEIWVLANVYESDISRIKEGQVVEIEMISFPDETTKGRIDKIYTILDPETQTMKVRVTLPNPNYKYKPEMNCVVNLQFDEMKEMISIPSKAIVFDKNKNFVMVYKSKNDIETREVKIYKTSGDKSYIASGLESGEKIISKEQLFIYDAIND